MMPKIICDLNAIANQYLVASGAIDLYDERICDAIEDYLAALSSRIQYVVDYQYDYYDHTGFFTVAVYDTVREDMNLFCYKYTEVNNE